MKYMGYHERRMQHHGFTYLTLLFIVAIMGITLAAAGVVWETAQKREREKELLFVGDQYRKAIGLYYNRSPGVAKKYPPSFEDLLKDPRQLAPQRYLRKIYYDPITRSKEWGIITAPTGGIMGVYSLSEEEPIKTANFKFADADFEGKTKYSEWQFIYLPKGTGQPGSHAAPGRPNPALFPDNMGHPSDVAPSPGPPSGMEPELLPIINK